MVFAGYDPPPKWGAVSAVPQEDTSLRGNTLYDLSSVHTTRVHGPCSRADTAGEHGCHFCPRPVNPARGHG